MKILMLAQFYPPALGGEERHVHALSTKLVERGHEVIVVTLWHQGDLELEESQGVRIYRIKGSMQRLEILFSEKGRKYAPSFPDPELLLAIRRIVEAEEPDIVHAHNWLVHSFLPLKPFTRTKLVMTLHDYSLICPQKRLMYRDKELCSGPELKKCLECSVQHYGKVKGLVTASSNYLMSKLEKAAVDMFIPVSQAVAQGTGLINSGLPYQVIPNFVPNELGQRVEEEEDHRLAQLPKEDFLLFVGDLSRDKGVSTLLEAYSQLDTIIPLVLIGQRRASTPSYLPPGVRMLESWPHKAVMQAWNRSLLGLAPSVWRDPCPTVVLEAMATGRAIVGTRLGGMTDLIVNAETGFLVEPGDPLALKQAIDLLIQQPALRRRFEVAARLRVLQFQASQVVSLIEQVYCDLTQSVVAHSHKAVV